MKLKKLIKPMFAAFSTAQDLMDTGRDALLKAERHRSSHLSPWKRNAMKASGAAALSLAFGGLAIFSFLQLEKQSRRHQAWKKADAQLDSDLADTLDASDAVAKY